MRPGTQLVLTHQGCIDVELCHVIYNHCNVQTLVVFQDVTQ